MFSSRSFLVLGFICRPLMYFELIFAYGIRWVFNFFHLLVDIQFSYYHLLKRLSFFFWMVLAPCAKIIWPFIQVFISGFSIPSVYMSVFMPVPHYFDYRSFVVKFYLRDKERECMWVGGEVQKEKGRENPKPSPHLVQSPMEGSISWPEPKHKSAAQLWLSHPGTPCSFV